MKGYGVVPQGGDEDLEMAGQEEGVTDAHADDDTWDDMGGEDSADGEETMTPRSDDTKDIGNTQK